MRKEQDQELLELQDQLLQKTLSIQKALQEEARPQIRKAVKEMREALMKPQSVSALRVLQDRLKQLEGFV